MKRITIKSYWSDSDDDDNVEGYFRVNVPKKHENDYLNVIREASSFITSIGACSFNIDPTPEEIEEWRTENNIVCLSKDFLVNNFESAENYAIDGTYSLQNVLDFLHESERGWSYSDFCYVCDDKLDHSFDVDSNQFDW